VGTGNVRLDLVIRSWLSIEHRLCSVKECASLVQRGESTHEFVTYLDVPTKECLFQIYRISGAALKLIYKLEATNAIFDGMIAAEQPATAGSWDEQSHALVSYVYGYIAC
jgi:hypothetical protein